MKEYTISAHGASGDDASFSVQVNPPISTSVAIGPPGKVVPFTPPQGYFIIGKFPCKARLMFNFRKKWSVEIKFPDGSLWRQKHNTPDEIMVHINPTTNDES